MGETVAYSTNIRTASEIMKNIYQVSDRASSFFMAEVVLGILRPWKYEQHYFPKLG